MTEPLLAGLREVLRRYGLTVAGGGEPRRAGGGFSGADVWQVSTEAGPLCVRRWPAEHPAPGDTVYHCLRWAAAGGCRFVPVPHLADDGCSSVEVGGRSWEVTPWMPGEAATGPLNAARRTALLAALAEFHAAMARLCASLHDSAADATELSPGLAERCERLDRALISDLPQLRYAPVPEDWQALAARRDEFCQLFTAAAPQVREQLRAARPQPGLRLHCIRDIRREHVLFTGDQVTGWVDFGSLRREFVAADVARVLGEFYPDEPAEWDAIVDEYRRRVGNAAVGPVSPAVIRAFDAGTVLLAPLNWLRWILLEERDFADRAAVLARFDQLLARLRRRVEHG